MKLDEKRQRTHDRLIKMIATLRETPRAQFAEDDGRYALFQSVFRDCASDEALAVFLAVCVGEWSAENPHMSQAVQSIATVFMPPSQGDA